MRTLMWTAALVLLGGLGAVVAYPRLHGAPAPSLTLAASDIDPAALRERARGMDLMDNERVWERIPWVTTYEDATALSAQTGRPIFLFSMWGELDSRC